jgi:hypothetical protein
VSVGLTPFDDNLWQLRLAASELAALQTDWAHVAGPHPGHDFRRSLVRAREAIGRARAAIESGRHPSPSWRERARGHMRAARRLLVQRQLAHHAPWWPAGRRYLG